MATLLRIPLACLFPVVIFGDTAHSLATYWPWLVVAGGVAALWVTGELLMREPGDG